MKKKMLSVADRYLTEISFLIKKQGCDLSLINGDIYWVDANDNESSYSVSYKIYKELVSNGILCENRLGGLKVATPVYMLAIGVDPREYIEDLDEPKASEILILEFNKLIADGRELPINGLDGYTVVW